MGLVFRASMFITSFLPLWITIIIKNIATILQNPETNGFMARVVIGAIIAINLIAGSIVCRRLKTIKRRSPSQVELKRADREKTLNTEFLVAYILPLFVFDFTDALQVVQFLVYFLILGFLCIRNGNVYANLLLEIKKYRCYTCQVYFFVAGEYGEISILSRQHLDNMPNCQLDLEALNKPVYLDQY